MLKKDCCSCPQYCHKKSLLSAISSTQFGLGDSELSQLSQNVGGVYFGVCDDLSVPASAGPRSQFGCGVCIHSTYHFRIEPDQNFLSMLASP